MHDYHTKPQLLAHLHIALLSLTLYLGLLILLPVVLWQGKRTRDKTPRLPEAAGERAGFIPTAPGNPLRLLLIGESTAAGVGVEHMQQGLIGYLTRGLAEQQHRGVLWHLLGQNGATLAELRAKLQQAEPIEFDIAVLVTGVNDTTALRTPLGWRRELRGMLDDLNRRQPEARIYVSAVPPLHLFPALPQPLRLLMGLQATRLRLTSQGLINTLPYATHLYPDFSPAAGLFARDGFHPSEAGYARWAGDIVKEIA